MDENGIDSLNLSDFKKSGILVCIVVPTYNEAENIKKLLSLIYSKENCRLFKERNILTDVLVVDDNSPDGTAKKVRQYQKKNPRVHLLLRDGKNGLGSAYIAGMRHAMLTINPDVLFEMDADLSHNPKYIMPMILEILNGADFVIGSRYIDSGSVPKDWGAFRRLISSAANAYARFALGMFNVRDCTGGFRAIKASMLKKINLDSLGSKGYVFQISLLNAAISRRGIVKEIPIDFQNRNSGSSKMGLSDILEVGLTVFRMGLQRISAQAPSFEEREFIEEPAQSIVKV